MIDNIKVNVFICLKISHSQESKKNKTMIKIT